ncbi:alpha/beta hydrolase [Niveibacterium sp. SC-1]|uniref:alpha/beta hydrolase n=1 Tax=Niveibacterium sp. SC-1 TaxID=3135646 RepID=UPI00311DC143
MSRYQYRHADISIQADRAWLNAVQSHVPDARALAIFYSASPIASSESREFVSARVLQDADYATLLVNGLTGYEEKRDPDARYNVPKLTDRLLAVLDWVSHQPHLDHLPICLHGTNTAAAAILKAAARATEPPFALVSRGGRPDLAGAEPLRQNHIPLLIITGGSRDDTRGPANNAMSLLGGERASIEIPTASELFVEPGTLDQASRAALEWFERWRPALPAPAPTDETT